MAGGRRGKKNTGSRSCSTEEASYQAGTNHARGIDAPQAQQHGPHCFSEVDISHTRSAHVGSKLTYKVGAPINLNFYFGHNFEPDNTRRRSSELPYEHDDPSSPVSSPCSSDSSATGANEATRIDQQRRRRDYRTSRVYGGMKWPHKKRPSYTRQEDLGTPTRHEAQADPLLDNEEMPEIQQRIPTPVDAHRPTRERSFPPDTNFSAADSTLSVEFESGQEKKGWRMSLQLHMHKT
ncbi:hypothetical protein F4777DRAFT_41208 [Nemania sp. FL0916]|nr:hypothetical protein F4777DRAFT_41208 [Nemania sp. FL0916]